MATKNEARKDKLTLVQIRYMEKRINAARDVAEEKVRFSYDAEKAKLPQLEERKPEEVAKALVDKHPTLTKAMAANIACHDHKRLARDLLAVRLGLDTDWLCMKDEHKAREAVKDKLVARYNTAVGAIKAIAVEATDAIYLGDASQLNTILSKMDKVKF